MYVDDFAEHVHFEQVPALVALSFLLGSASASASDDLVMITPMIKENRISEARNASAINYRGTDLRFDRIMSQCMGLHRIHVSSCMLCSFRAHG